MRLRRSAGQRIKGHKLAERRRTNVLGVIEVDDGLHADRLSRSDEQPLSGNLPVRCHSTRKQRWKVQVTALEAVVRIGGTKARLQSL